MGRLLSVPRRCRRGKGPRTGGGSMRKGMIVLVLLGFLVQQPQRLEAGAFATEITQLLNHAQLILQYIRQGTQLANELNMYAYMLKNSRTLSSHTFVPIFNDINALANSVHGGQHLANSPLT